MLILHGGDLVPLNLSATGEATFSGYSLVYLLVSKSRSAYDVEFFSGVYSWTTILSSLHGEISIYWLLLTSDVESIGISYSGFLRLS